MSFGTAISGLNAASADLNTIGNNVANSATTGFKESRAEFADVYPVSAFGTPSTSIGSGVRLAAVTQRHTQGNISFTNNSLDLAISGQGFFRMSDNGTVVYSRAGAFGLDRLGYMANSAGLRLTGYLADPAGNITGALGDLQVSFADLAPQATANMTVGVNLNAAATVPPVAPFDPTNANTYNNATSTTIYDSLGNTHLASMYYVRTAPLSGNTWDTYLYVDGNAVGAANALQFNNTGALIVPAAGTIAYPAYNPLNGAAPITMTLDYSNTTQFGSPFGVNTLTQDGYTTGRLGGVDVDETGVVFGRYTNGQSRAQGQVVLTNFANPQGLRPLGDTSWAETFESGSALTGAPGTASLGLVQGGGLEDSNVNLTEQLVAMIIAQRNFQANAQVISTEDSITQTIINIR